MDGPRVANDFMVTRLVTLGPQMDVFRAIRLLLRNQISGAPVVDDWSTYLGVFSEKCCMSVLTLTARLASQAGLGSPKTAQAKDFMATRLVTFSPEMDVFEAIGLLLRHRISGAPVIDAERRFLGVFSEKTSMSVLIESAYDQLPTSAVGAFMNTEMERTISDDADLLTVAQRFLDTPYRRLPVLRDGRLVGQVSRRDVLRAEHHLSGYLRDRDTVLLDESSQIDLSDGPEAAHGRLPSTAVWAFMDTQARTIEEDTDLLTIAQIFLSTPYRRLPVLRAGKLVGQISRRDVLRVAHDLNAFAPVRETSLLYLSSLVERHEAPIA